MTIVLALLAAAAYGSSDFIGGLVSRKVSPWSVAVVAQATSAVSAFAAAVFIAGDPSRADFLWALVAGVGFGFGVVFLFRGLGSGQMSVVAPVSAVGSAVVPVLVDLMTGGRPPAAVGAAILTAIVGIWLVSSTPADESAEQTAARRANRASGLRDGLLAGLGFGAGFSLLDQTSSTAGLWPVALVQTVSMVFAAGLATAWRQPWLPRDRAVLPAAWAGPLGTLALVFFLLATRSGSLTVAALLSSFYPASTILLAVVVLHERIHRTQGWGLVLCAVTVGLVALP